MKNTKPNYVSLEALHTHTHTCSASGYLECNKNREDIRHKYICVCFAYICKTDINMPVSFCA